MDKTLKYTCSCCGKNHEEWPAIAFDSPSGYHVLSKEEKTEIAELSNDFCIVLHPEQTDRFIRVTLTIKVVDHCESLDYGVWVSLSEKSYDNYSVNFRNEQHGTSYFGWLASDVPGYDMRKSIPITVSTRNGCHRPEIVPQEDVDHPLVYDYYNGITKAEAERRINHMLSTVAKRDNPSAKPWWKKR